MGLVKIRNTVEANSPYLDIIEETTELRCKNQASVGSTEWLHGYLHCDQLYLLLHLSVAYVTRHEKIGLLRTLNLITF